MNSQNRSWILSKIALGLCLWMNLGASVPVMADEIMPPPGLQKQLQQFLKTYQGQILKLELKQQKGETVYILQYIDSQGQLKKVQLTSQGQQIQKSQHHTPRIKVKLLSLNQLLQKHFAAQPIRLLEAELENSSQGYIYELEWLDGQGVVWKGRFNAHTGQQIMRRRD